jgi:hypothetical protein
MTIIGGSNAAGASGNMRSGYTTHFLPCRCNIMPPAVIAAYNAGRELPVYFKVRVKNTLGAWVEIPDCGYVQINKNPEADTESTSITIQDSETWSAYNALHEGLLKPSNRIIQVLAGITENNLAPLFTGKITNYQQPEGSDGGAINLTCKDIRAVLQRQNATSFLPDQTNYHAAKIQLHSGFRAAGINFAAQFTDAAGSIALAGSKMDAINTVAPDKQWYNASNGAVIVASKLFESVEAVGSLIELSDDNILVATRSISDDSAFNSVLVQGLSGGVVVSQTVSDAADVADRGSIFFSGGIVGTTANTIAQSVEIAEAMIYSSLLGRFDIEVPFNPYFELGQVVKIQSDRFNIPDSFAILSRVRHQYQVGNAVTYLDQLEIQEA